MKLTFCKPLDDMTGPCVRRRLAPEDSATSKARAASAMLVNMRTRATFGTRRGMFYRVVWCFITLLNQVKSSINNNVDIVYSIEVRTTKSTIFCVLLLLLSCFNLFCKNQFREVDCWHSAYRIVIVYVNKYCLSFVLNFNLENNVNNVIFSKKQCFLFAKQNNRAVVTLRIHRDGTIKMALPRS